MFKSKILAGSLFVLLSHICAAGDIRITNISPPAGIVTKIVSDPINEKLIFAIIGERVYRSDNGGLFWKPSNLIDVTALGIDRKGTRIFAAAHGRQIYNDFRIWLSTDKAKSFKVVGASRNPFREIFPHPILSKVLFAFGCYGWDVCASMDRGATWQEFRNLPVGEANYDQEYFNSGLLFVPGSRNEVFLSGRLYRNHQRSLPFLADTGDLGKSWKQIQPRELRFLQSKDQIFAYGKSGIYKYLHGNWNLISNESLEQMIVAKDNLKELWGVGSDFVSYKRILLRSLDGGLSWQQVDTPFADRILLGKATNDSLLIGTQGGGFYKFSKDVWNWSGKGIKDSSLSSISFSQADHTLYTLGNNFIQTYDIKKASWKDLSWYLKRIEGEDIYSIYVDPFNSNHIYLRTSFDRLLHSTDGGKNWDSVSSAANPVFDPYRPGIVFMSAYGPTLLKSVDSGKTFESLPVRCTKCPRYIYNLTIDPFDENVLYLTLPGGIWKSVDGGKTIQKTGKVSPGALAPLSIRNHYLLLGGNGTLYKTTNGGINWLKLSDLLQPISSRPVRLVTLKEGKIIFAIHDYSKLFLSVNGGKKWSSPLPERYEAVDIAVNSDRSVFVSTRTGLFNIEIAD
jgi:hypothetical protein